MITKITKMVPVTYFVIDGIEFVGSELICTLDDVLNILGNEIGELELGYSEVAEDLAELGYLEKTIRYGEAMYRDTKDKKAEALLNELLKM
jgi:hypothetical protein